MAPLVAELERHPGEIINKTCFTGQHRDMAIPILEYFGVRVDYDLDVMRDDQTLEYLTVRMLEDVGRILSEERFDYVLVQGDTTTSMAAGLAAFYRQCKVGHVEAGLRTYDKYQPYPEEANRRMIDSVSDLFFAHTDLAKDNLLKEGYDQQSIAVTGNTVIDALLDVAGREYEFQDRQLIELVETAKTRKLILVTAHRRESFGQQFFNMCEGMKQLARDYGEEVLLVYPVHRNPNVRRVVMETLGEFDNIVLIDPLDYVPFVHLMKSAHIILTDSGGIQEEAPSLGKPVLVMRKVTERQEAVSAGTVKLVGTDTSDIVGAATELLDDPAAYARMASKENPYGEGRASKLIVERLLAEQ